MAGAAAAVVGRRRRDPPERDRPDGACRRRGARPGQDGRSSHWQDCYSADALSLSPSLLIRLLKVEGGAAE